MALITSSLSTDLVTLLVTIVAVVYAYFKWSYQYWKRKNLPYLEPRIPFGNLPNPITSNESNAERIRNLYNEAKAKGWKHCGIYFMALPTYMIVDLELLKNVMTKDFNHFVDRGIYVNERDEPIGNHLFSMAGTRWKNLRAKLTPTFTSGKMRTMFQTIADSGEILEKFIKENVADKEVANIKDILGRFGTDVIGSCAFGLECNSFENPNNPFRTFGKKVLEADTIAILKDAFTFNFPNLSRALRMRSMGKDVEDFYTKVVEDTISYREKNNVTRNDFMQLLMAMRSNTEQKDGEGDGNTLTLNEIVAQSFVFFIAGFETSSTTMTFVLFELARHQDIQDKVREEMRTVLEKYDNKITYDSMNDLVYTKQVIDEALRMYPPVVILNRECTIDYKVPGEDFVLEKGTQVFIPVMGIHYDKDYYENPTEFNPDRFSQENKKNIPQYAQLPFGQGPRVCIGERFGVMQTKVGLTSILRNFRVSVNEKTKIPLKIDPKAPVLSAEGGIWLNIEKL